jgi:hypothetical protein
MHRGNLIPLPIVAGRHPWNSVHWNYDYYTIDDTEDRIQIQLSDLRSTHPGGNGMERTSDRMSVVPDKNHSSRASQGRDKVPARDASKPSDASEALQ